jgi:hypothetical protein
VGARQRACSRACQAARKKTTQAAWTKDNPDYFVARRMKQRAAAERRPAPLRMPAPLDRLPWDVAQDEFGVQQTDFLGHLGRVLLGVAQAERQA